MTERKTQTFGNEVDFETILLEHKDKLSFLGGVFIGGAAPEMDKHAFHGLALVLDELRQEAQVLYDSFGDGRLKEVRP